MSISQDSAEESKEKTAIQRANQSPINKFLVGRMAGAHGAEVSVLPLSKFPKDKKSPDIVLTAANGSTKPFPAETKYNTVYRELLAIYFSIKYVTHILETRQFPLLTDRKPSTLALQSKTDISSRKTTHMEYISQLTSSGDSNVGNLPSAFEVDAVKSKNL
uniref:RT_RNaseH domain-containing protein n=1 Tax=Glossina austeni TaxID=7395 RepID=A0A1A9VIF3_GLOAU